MSAAGRKLSVVPFAVATALTGMLLAAAAVAEAGTVEPDKVFKPAARLCVHQIRDAGWGTDLFVRCVKNEIDQRIEDGTENSRFKQDADRAWTCVDAVGGGVAEASERDVTDKLVQCLFDATAG
ncbi:hypothetical protein NBRGN_096_00240 [Nocardia brasiliensis NBRC 14402]|uniref:hypothetical protein n=1 Tax=Nocardia brasiliensis TaxID=37326 RepID=UPI00031BF307|nr:hypothetical protein [Nocardia brasiliensis]ASF06460.1 hypothetical protein CEQ30_02905 [Nocardia brasiliensis]GAJ85550.1 hypothetical protein NBRGN_096_00240 [Nocardia brasiliensis NBRC 14402]SUB48419.1 Uncharacterised protein [Nocardia brasiliensis]